jgi:hypothetical protein
MSELERNSDQLNTVREAVSQALGLTLTDNMIGKILEGESLSLDQLTEHHTPTEIGTALIRLDCLSKIFPAKDEASLRVCIGRWCWNFMPIPPM